MKSAVSPCPIEEAMVVLSGRWPTLLLYYLQQGTKRFGELQKDNPTISHRILAHELRKLEVAGIVIRTAHAGYPSRVDYSLSAAGCKLLPLLEGLGDWWSENQAARESARQQGTAPSSRPDPSLKRRPVAAAIAGPRRSA
jgi:DNA-binding HxlR family transcriptional regulator